MLTRVQTISAAGAVARSRRSVSDGVVAQSETAGHVAPGSGVRRQAEPLGPLGTREPEERQGRAHQEPVGPSTQNHISPDASMETVQTGGLSTHC